MKARADICNECPFRRVSAAGWLGANDPESFASAAVSETSLGCHLQMDQTLARDKWVKVEAETPRCRGALTMMRNECKLPHGPVMAALARSIPADRETVFSHRLEFIKHHNGATVKSWEFED